jgi:hypothetical protein
VDPKFAALVDTPLAVERKAFCCRLHASESVSAGIAGKNRVAGRRRIVVGESIILAGDDGDGHGALQVSAGRAASAVLPCPQVLPRPIARFAERRSGCGPQFRHRTPEGAQGRELHEGRYRRVRLKSLKSGELTWDAETRLAGWVSRTRTQKCCPKVPF